MFCRPLPDEFVRYARTDTHYLLYIYDRMKNDLLERVLGHKNLLMSVFAASKLICAKVSLINPASSHCLDRNWPLGFLVSLSNFDNIW